MRWQNARLVTDAERYYRIMYYGSRASWNLRDTHMFETLKTLLDFHGVESKAIVWAHNSHIGDAAATEMSARGEYNIGHLCREEFGNGAYSMGFGTHSGTVAAASDWDGPMEVVAVSPSLKQSYERLCHETAVGARHDVVDDAVLSRRTLGAATKKTFPCHARSHVAARRVFLPGADSSPHQVRIHQLRSVHRLAGGRRYAKTRRASQ
jgi:erythromycin esterase-like protein